MASSEEFAEELMGILQTGSKDPSSRLTALTARILTELPAPVQEAEVELAEEVEQPTGSVLDEE